MATKYLLPCPCGKSIPVETSRAGETITCACGNRLNVPTLRGLRELEPAKEAQAAPDRAAGRPVDWSAPRGMVFSLALLTFVVALAYGSYHLFIWSDIDVEHYEAHQEASADEYLDQMTPVALLEFWNDTKDKALKDTLPPGHVSVRDVSDYYRLRGIGGLVVTALSGALVAWSLFGKRSSPGTTSA